MKGRRFAACLAVAALALLPGCGVGAGDERSGAGVDLRVTRDFGHQLVLAKNDLPIREDETVMRLLKRNAEVETRFGGGFVQSIDGLAGKGGDATSDWFYFVNGIEAAEGAADYELSPGDVIQWDRRDWGETAQVRAIVGAYPQPLLDGIGGKRFPVRVECQDADSNACGDVKQTLRDAGIPATGGTLGAPGNQNVARVIVADWASARELPTARLVEQGPQRSGVFARFSEDGARLELLGAGRRAGARGAPWRGPGRRAAPDRQGAALARHRFRRGGRRGGRVRSARPRPARRLRGRRRGRAGEQAASEGEAVSAAAPRSARRELPIPVYRAGTSPLHSARAGATASLCLALAAVCMLYDDPLVLATVIAAVVAAGVAAGVGREIARVALLALPLVLLVALVNPLVYREGDTLLVRGGELLGRRIDITLEALVAGGLAGMRVAAIVMAFGLFSACVDPDELLRMFRRVSYRSALTGALATRLVPVLARDALRMGDAARCRPARAGTARGRARRAVGRARPRGRGGGGARGARLLGRRPAAAPARGRGRVTTCASRRRRAQSSSSRSRASSRAPARCEVYPRIDIAAGPPEALLCVLLLASVALPFAGRGARLGVARA